MFASLARANDLAPASGAWLLAAALAATILVPPAAAQSGVTLAVVPQVEVAAPGDTVHVDLQVTAAGADFNAYQAVVVFDPDRLRILPLAPTTAQEGPLMVDACPDRFHAFAVADDQASATISHGLLCAGLAITGPGSVYRLRFEALPGAGETEIGLGPATAFYDAGAAVPLDALIAATVVIDQTVAVDPGGDEAAAHPLPAAAVLDQNAPNPFNPSTTIRFATAAAGHVSLVVFDLRGRRVAALVDGPRPAGEHAVAFDGRGLASGTYVYRLVTRDRTLTRTMQLVK